MKKRLLVTLMSMIMCLSMSTVAFAADASKANVSDAGWQLLETSVTDEEPQVMPRAGTETWYFTGYLSNYAGNFTMEGRNLTPVKTIDTNSYNKYLTIDAEFTCDLPSILTVQIREYPSGTVLAQNSSSVTTDGRVVVQAGSLSSSMSGKQVQIFFRITDANGNYIDSRECNIDYWYNLRGIGDDGLQ